MVSMARPFLSRCIHRLEFLRSHIMEMQRVVISYTGRNRLQCRHLVPTFQRTCFTCRCLAELGSIAPLAAGSKSRCCINKGVHRRMRISITRGSTLKLSVSWMDQMAAMGIRRALNGFYWVTRLPSAFSSRSSSITNLQRETRAAILTTILMP